MLANHHNDKVLTLLRLSMPTLSISKAWTVRTYAALVWISMDVSAPHPIRITIYPFLCCSPRTNKFNPKPHKHPKRHVHSLSTWSLDSLMCASFPSAATSRRCATQLNKYCIRRFYPLFPHSPFCRQVNPSLCKGRRSGMPD